MNTKYIFLRSYFKKMMSGKFNSEIYNAINENISEPSQIIANKIKGFEGNVMIRTLDEDFAEFCLSHMGQDYSVGSAIQEYCLTHDENYFSKVWQESSATKEYDVVAVILNCDFVPTITVPFAKKIAKCLKLTPAFQNVTDIKVCFDPIPFNDYVLNQEEYQDKMLKAYATESMTNDFFGFSLDENIQYNNKNIDKLNYKSMKDSYCMCFIVQTTIPQVVNYDMLTTHSYSVRNKSKYTFTLPNDCVEVDRYLMDGNYYSRLLDFEE